MKLIFALLFTVICKPGIITEADGAITEIWGENKREYYYYDLEYPDGVYLYTSLIGDRDSIWFMISEKEVIYDVDNPKNEEFELHKIETYFR